MQNIIDTIMIALFVLFMVWIIRGYHADKYEKRYGDTAHKKENGRDETSAR